MLTYPVRERALLCLPVDKDTCNEEMWADVDKSPSAYDKGKAIAERAAWDFMKEQVPGQKADLQ